MIYAKSEPKESLREHTDGLISQLELLKSSYGNQIETLLDDAEEFWEFLRIAIEFHDVGKIFTPFQNVIREKINENPLDTPFTNNINHNYLSPAFIKFDEIGITDPKKKKILRQAIAFHHERDEEINTEFRNQICEVLENDLIRQVPLLQEEFKIAYPVRTKRLDDTYLKDLKQRINVKDEYFNFYVLLKGLLHKLDHSASAHEAIELDVNENIGEYTERFLTKAFGGLKSVQQFAKDNKDKNVVIIASTGMGKTETALLWIDNNKSFFTLPLRVSINALYDRISKTDEEGICYSFAGLMHSTSIDYLQEQGYEGWENISDSSKLLSKKLTFSTIDQIFKFPFLFRGYEKIYATLAYSKVVIDEIQAYSPEIAAVLIKGLELIHKIGGRFMVMTATMPTIYLDEMKKRGLLDKDLAMEVFNTPKPRHHIKLMDTSLLSNLEQIVLQGTTQKVLVIVNTVKDAVNLYDQLENLLINKEEKVSLQLLHSMFIAEDRSQLEQQIKSFAKSNKIGIWITTQLVEASLDIDFDVLHTQVSTLDSLFQRFGRCNRKGEKSIAAPNIFIYTEQVSGIGTIYDENIVHIGVELLKGYLQNEPCITEEGKVELVKELYSKSNLEGTKFYDKFQKALEALDIMEAASLSSNEAQDILREIENITAIPRSIYNELSDTLIKQYKELERVLQEAYKVNDKMTIKELKETKREVRRRIMNKTVNVPLYRVRAANSVTPIFEKGLENIYVLEYEYDVLKDEEKNLKGRGILLGKELSQFI